MFSSSVGKAPLPVRHYENFIDGRLSPSLSKSWIDVKNPATNEVIARTPNSLKSEIDEAVQSSKKAFGFWREVPVQQRARVMFDLVRLIKERTDELAQLITLENGKTLTDSRGDIFRGLEVVEAACSSTVSHMMGSSLENISRGMDCVTYKQPLGVVAGICPFNFPAMIPLWMFPIACTTGCSFILKPSEQTPGCAMLLSELATEAGLPRGVLNIVHGGKETVDYICDSAEIKAISFVGGNKAGEYIHSRGSATGKRVQANLGAKNHATVMPDADRESTVKAIVGAAFGAGGQRCMALSVVIFVGESKFWIEDIVYEARKVKVGDGFDDVDMGPLISENAKRRCLSIISQAIEEGAEVKLDGRDIKKKLFGESSGNYLGPTILHIANLNNIAYTEEIFGPVLCCVCVSTLDEAIKVTNGSRYGNGCAIFTQNGSIARKFTHDIDIGQVGVNVPIPVPLPMFSFTGSKASFRGNVHFYGEQGVAFYTQTKTITSNWNYDAQLFGLNMPLVK